MGRGDFEQELDSGELDSRVLKAVTSSKSNLVAPFFFCKREKFTTLGASLFAEI
jgi:hypothetical protein